MLTRSSIAIVVTNIVLDLIDIAAVSLRILAHRSRKQSLSIDDYFIIISLFVVLCGSGGYIAAAISGGVGHHMRDISAEETHVFFKFIFALQFVYITSVTLIKLSILLFYRRIFPTPRFKVTVSIVCGFVLAWFVTFSFATLFQTIPISNNWASHGSSNAHGRTIRLDDMYTANSALEITLDIVTLCLPLFVVWRLQMCPSQKLVVSGIFLLGAFVCVASIVRLYYLAIHLNPSQEEQEDLTYNLGDIILWSSVEPCVGVICACLPTLRPVINRQSLYSTIASIRGLLSLRSGSSDQTDSFLSAQNRFQHTKVQKLRPFYPMDEEHSLVRQVYGRAATNGGGESLPMQTIELERSLGADVGDRL
ncbi:hypothetical protein EV356DRAFT_568444 [Viridothelium virens]|uniref:Rhodopsin domain-containing protein n=1 Tax=Viridothelium virens TaxID=1048519 RepID=A0A6A6H4E4_VIRVR|nr:hypothetical protein EV356DRAFT_568444 [Viridothelium virens]